MPTSPEFVTSDRNPLLREARKALTRGELTPDGCCAAESVHLFAEARHSGLTIKAVIAAQSAHEAVEHHMRDAANARLLIVPDALFAGLATTEAPQGVITLLKAPQWTLDDLFTATPNSSALVVVLDGIQDPGNAGNIVRTAEAFGATGVLFPKGTVSPFNAKTLRASAGSLFRVPFVTGIAVPAVRDELERRGVEIYSAMPRASRTIIEADLRQPLALIVGSEGHGVSEPFQQLATGVRIPTQGVESLNAAMAAGVVLYEAARQRETPSA